jgi:CHAD domain-containing protein
MARTANYFYRRLLLMRGHLLATRSSPTAREIHDLRVATRRTTEVIAILAHTGDIPMGQARYCRKHLRQLRRSAGGIRDLDVCIERMKAQSTASGGTSLGHRRLSRTLSQRRSVAIARLNRQLKRSASDVVLHRWIDRAQTLELHLDPNSLHRALQGRLANHHDRFIRRAQRAQALPTPHHIHQTRIAAKRWRYLLELLHDIRTAPPEMISALVEHLKTFQKAAGELQDAIYFQSYVDGTPANENLAPAIARLTRNAIKAMEAVH